MLGNRVAWGWLEMSTFDHKVNVAGITRTEVARLVYCPSAPSGREVWSKLRLQSLKVDSAWEHRE